MVFGNTSVITALMILVFTYFKLHTALIKSGKRSWSRNNEVAADVVSTVKREDSKIQGKDRKVTRVFLTIWLCLQLAMHLWLSLFMYCNIVYNVIVCYDTCYEIYYILSSYRVLR